jgi:hypothetical protein
MINTLQLAARKNRQVTHNAHLYENQDSNVLEITNLTFKTGI